MKSYTAEVVLHAQAELGEGALWDSGRAKLWWVDIVAGVVHCFDPKTKQNDTIHLRAPVGAVVCGEANDLFLAVNDGFAQYDLGSGTMQMVATIAHENASARFNDGKCDPHGRFWAGTLAQDGTSKIGSLFCLENDMRVTRKISGVGISNGIGWSPSGDTMYYIDSSAQNIVGYDYRADDGSISSPWTVIEIKEKTGTPDGMCVDVEGMLWVALWNGGRVIRIDPYKGEIIDEVVVPNVSRVTSCAFGGENRTTLFITTARQGLSPHEEKEQPHAGSLFGVEVGIAGMPAYVFSG